MKLYFIVDRYKTVLDNRDNLINQYGARALDNKSTLTPDTPDMPCYVWCNFGSEGAIDQFSALPGVEQLPDPFENDLLTDDQMEKLAPALELEVKKFADGKRTFHDKRRGAEAAALPQNHHTRKAMKWIADNKDKDFRFRP